MKPNKSKQKIQNYRIKSATSIPVAPIGTSEGRLAVFENTNNTLVGLQAQVAEAQRFSDAIIANLREPMLVLDKNLQIKTCNNAFYKAFLANEPAIEGKLIYELGNGEWDISALRNLLEKILPEKTRLVDFELTHTFSNIGACSMMLNAQEIINSNGAERLILLSIEDITERKLLQFKEKQSLTSFYNLLLQIPLGIVLYRGSNYIVEQANDMAVGKIINGKNFIGKPLFESMPEIEAKIKPIFDNIMRNGIDFSANEFELPIFRYGKTEKAYFNLFYKPIFEADKTISGILSTATEVTKQVNARKKMEVQNLLFQDMLMTAPGFVATLAGRDHVYDLVNAQYQSLFGKRKIQGKPIMIALPELEGQGFDKLLDKVYDTGEPYVGINIPITLAHDEGLAPEERYFNFSYQPMYDEDKNIFSILVFGYEVTDQVTAAKKIEEYQEENNKILERKNVELQKMNKELEAFNYVSSHDLQEPLRKIQIYAERMLEDENINLSDNGKDMFSKLQAAAGRMQILIQDLLAFSSLRNKAETFENTNLTVIVEEVKEVLKVAIEEKNATIEVGQMCDIRIIPFQFQQLMQNLISNALKFSDSKIPPQIKIKCKIIASYSPFEGHRACHITVSDNGIGFEKEFSEKIFEIFQRLHSPKIYAGTGIGLAIVKKIVDNHNGIITATSELGKGAEFDIYIPA